MIEVEYRRTLEEVDALESDWERLFVSAVRQPSLSFEWSRALLQNHLASRQDWFVIVLKEQAEIVGIVPMMYVHERVLGVEVVTLQPIQQLYKTHGGLMLDTSDAKVIEGWLAALESAPQRWDLLRVSGLLEDDSSLRLFEAGAGAGRVWTRVRVEQPAFHLPLPSSFDEYLAARSGKFRNYLKRAAKKLDAQGVVTMTRLRDVDRFADGYEELLAIERGSWKHGHGTAISAIGHQSGFYRDLSRGALVRGRLHLTFLRIDSRAVAYNLGLVSHGCYYYLKTSYLESMRTQGVATVGRAKLIEQLIAEGVDAFDFSGEPYEWEQQWTNTLRWHRSLLLFNRTFRGALLWIAISALGLRTAGKRKRAVIFHDPRALRAPMP